MDQSKACTKTIGFYSETDDNKENTANTALSGELSTSENRTLAEERNSLNTKEQTPAMEDLEARLEDVHVTENCSESRRVCTSGEIENVEKISSSAVEEPIVMNGDGLQTEWNGDRTTVECAEDGGMGMEDDSDSEGWITPENFQQACEEMGGVLEEKANGIAVGCTTTDYAMQVRERKRREREREKYSCCRRRERAREREKEVEKEVLEVLYMHVFSKGMKRYLILVKKSTYLSTNFILIECDASNGSQCPLVGWNEN